MHSKRYRSSECGVYERGSIWTRAGCFFQPDEMACKYWGKGHPSRIVPGEIPVLEGGGSGLSVVSRLLFMCAT